jgi:hypothetical protein
MGGGCLARAGPEGWAGFQPLLDKSLYRWSHQEGIQLATWRATSMNTAQKKRKTRDTLMDALLVLNSLILLFSHRAAPRR